MTVLSGGSLTAFLQQIAQAVATVLKFDVTIVDHELIRLAGTGRYATLLNRPVPPSSSFARVMNSSKPCVIVDPKEDPACGGCEAMKNCTETCHASYPLMLDGEPLGVLALVGFTKGQRLRMIEHGPEYLAFIEHMARLVESAAQNIRITKELKKARDQLQGVVEAVGEGIIAIDEQGAVICCNRAAARILKLDGCNPIGRNLHEFCPEAPLLEVLATGTGHPNEEVAIASPRGFLRYVSSTSPLTSRGRAVGAVALLKSLEDIQRIIYQVSESQPDRAIDHILGQAPALQEAKQLALRAALSSATVLLRGESGTGKELFARAIHYHSPRGSGPFVAVNCAAIPEDLLEAELFGYEEGAFTGARKGGKQGKFELAHSGTLFLDEVSDCSLRLQAKLLRALDRGEIQRIGGVHTLTADVRVVAATNRDLERMVEHGEFREDLYFRLNVIPISIPPLRARKMDIIPLFRHFLVKHSAAICRTMPALSPEMGIMLETYHWPGNVRELENVAQYVLHACADDRVEPCHLPPRMTDASTCSPSEPGTRATHILPQSEWEKRAIREGLKRLGDTPHAKDILAKQLGMSRSTIYRRIRKYGL